MSTVTAALTQQGRASCPHRLRPDHRTDPIRNVPRTTRVHSGRMGSAALDDAALIVRVNDHDEAAIEALYERYGGSCFGLARRILDDAQLAEDVVQQVFLGLWKGTGYDPARGGGSTWLDAMTHHKARQSLRRGGGPRQRQARVPAHPQAQGAG